MPDRRGFLAAALAGGSVVGPVGVAVVAEDKTAPESEKKSEAATVPADDPAELWLARVKAAYPSDKLTPEAVEEIRSDIARYLAASKALSAFPLENGDAPAMLFRVTPAAG